MEDNEVIELKLSKREAHVVLRALSLHNASEDADKKEVHVCTWLAERILRIVSPELGPQPIAALYAAVEDIQPFGNNPRRPRRGGRNDRTI